MNARKTLGKEKRRQNAKEKRREYVHHNKRELNFCPPKAVSKAL